jgi:hypothetical protein
LYKAASLDVDAAPRRSTSSLEVMEISEVTSILDAGAKIVDPIVSPHGFHWVLGPIHKGHPGNAASGTFTRDDRRLELHFRSSLGLVTYRLGELTLSHAHYMFHIGHKADARYPGFSSDPLDAFRDLAYDLAHFGTDFLSGPGTEFRAAFVAAKDWRPVAGFKGLQ